MELMKCSPKFEMRNSMENPKRGLESEIIALWVYLNQMKSLSNELTTKKMQCET